MLIIEIPGRETLRLEHLVLDYNGTIAQDGKLLPAAAERISRLKDTLQVHILTADTHGTAAAECAGLGAALHTFPRAAASECKAEIVTGLSGGCVCVGNGYNDIAMLDLAALGIAVLEREGMCAALLPHADVAAWGIADALDLLLLPDRLRATLRT